MDVVVVGGGPAGSSAAGSKDIHFAVVAAAEELALHTGFKRS